MTIPPTGNATRRAHAIADIEGVRRQVEDGELDQATADRLVARYQAEIEGLVDEQPDRPTPSPTSARRVVGAVLLIGALTAVSVVAFAAIRPRDGGFVTGETDQGTDLASITNDQMESVIAANADLPEVAGMRIALGDRYFNEGAHSDALRHYLPALDGQLDKTNRAKALARIGWMSFISGRPDLAERYLGEAIEIDGGYYEWHLYLGLVRLEGCEPDGALEQLDPLTSDENVPLELLPDIQVAIDRARDLIATEGCA